MLIWTLGEIIYAPVASAYVADIAPEHLRGRYQGVRGALTRFAAWDVHVGRRVVGPSR